MIESVKANLTANIESFNIVFTLVIESVKANLTANIESFNIVFTFVIESTNALLIAKEVSTIACLFTFIRLLNDVVSRIDANAIFNSPPLSTNLKVSAL